MDNHKRIYRVYLEEGLNLRSKSPSRNRAAANRQSNNSNASSLYECWSINFVSDQLFDGTKFKGLTVMDIHSRKCLSLKANKSLKGRNVLQAMEYITFEQQALPKYIKVDKTSEFISKVLDKSAYENNVELNFLSPGKLTDNSFIKSFNGSFRNECLNVN